MNNLTGMFQVPGIINWTIFNLIILGSYFQFSKIL